VSEIKTNRIKKKEAMKVKNGGQLLNFESHADVTSRPSDRVRTNSK